MKKHGNIVVAIGIALATSTMGALAQSTDSATCDRLAAFPDDPDKPAGVAGNYEIPAGEIATALKACKAAAHAAGATHRTWFELGRAYEFSRQHAEAARPIARRSRPARPQPWSVSAAFMPRAQASRPIRSRRASCSSRRPLQAIRLA